MPRAPDPAILAVAAVAGLVGALGVVGADALWLVPLGHELAHGHLPRSIPFATAASSGWHDVPAAAQLVFWALYHALGGARGLVVAQVLAAAIGFGALAWGMRRESSSGTTLAVCGIVLVGALPATAVTDVSLFSLAFFPLLLALLESEFDSPSARVWLAVPLLAVWGNLHGGVLAGWALLGCYLIFGRARRAPGTAVGVLAAGTAALFLTPALWHTPSYYRGVLHSAPARTGQGLWTPLGFGGFSLVLLAAIVALAACATAAGWRRIRLWEVVALAGLALETIQVARTGVWLLFVLACPAARGLRLGRVAPRVLGGIAAVGAVAACALLVKGPLSSGSPALARIAAAQGRPVLAEALLGQQVALAGGRVWIDNPIDAFRSADQRLYLDWLRGLPSGAGAVSHAGYVLVAPGSAAAHLAARDGRLVLVRSAAGGILYRVKPGAG